MVDIVHISTRVMNCSFSHVADAINAWSKFSGSGSFDYPHADIMLFEHNNDLYLISATEKQARHYAFARFNLQKASDLLTIFGPSD